MLSGSRQSTFGGIGGIPLSEMMKAAELAGLTEEEDVDDFLMYLRVLDDEYRKVLTAKQQLEADQKPKETHGGGRVRR